MACWVWGLGPVVVPAEERGWEAFPVHALCRLSDPFSFEESFGRTKKECSRIVPFVRALPTRSSVSHSVRRSSTSRRVVVTIGRSNTHLTRSLTASRVPYDGHSGNSAFAAHMHTMLVRSHFWPPNGDSSSRPLSRPLSDLCLIFV